MNEPFQAARLKIKRAKEHIDELNRFVHFFASNPTLYSVGLEKGEAWYVDEELVITFYDSKEELRDEAALIIGDVYHNLRSALDILWYEIVSPTGLHTKWTRFPILDTWEQLVAKVGTSLKDGKISKSVYDLVLDSIQPCKERNFDLWSVEEANVIDKHQLLIPNFSLIEIEGIRIQNDEEVIELGPQITDSDIRRRAHLLGLRSFGKNPKVIDKGRATLGYGFDLGHPHSGQPVLLTLNAVTKEVTRTVKAFAVLLG
jgi:hypothetical protein